MQLVRVEGSRGAVMDVRTAERAPACALNRTLCSDLLRVVVVVVVVVVAVVVVIIIVVVVIVRCLRRP